MKQWKEMILSENEKNPRKLYLNVQLKNISDKLHTKTIMSCNDMT